MTDDIGEVALTVESNGVAQVLISQPRRRNALTLRMWHELRAQFLKVAADDAVRCVIVKGAGDHFSAGADISEFGQVRTGTEASERYEATIDDAMGAMRSCPKPVIAALSGAAIGGGLSIALACDLRVADKSARLGIPAAKLGIVYGLLDCTILSDCVGVANAKMMLFTGRIFEADEARRLRLIDVAPESDSLSAALELAREIAGNAPLSIAGMKAILGAIAAGDTKASKARLEEGIRTAINSVDYLEGVAAFRARREPRFTGR